MLRLRIQKFEDVTILHCAGRFAFPQAAELRTAIVRRVRTPVLIVDMRDTVSIDAAGLGALVSLLRWARRAQRIFKLMNVTPRVGHLLRLTKLNFEIEICSAREILYLLCLAIRTDEFARTGPPVQEINHAEMPGEDCTGAQLSVA